MLIDSQVAKDTKTQVQIVAKKVDDVYATYIVWCHNEAHFGCNGRDCD
jgi:hypothetical protein